jgi:hypothetical protein
LIAAIPRNQALLDFVAIFGKDGGITMTLPAPGAHMPVHHLRNNISVRIKRTIIQYLSGRLQANSHKLNFKEASI